MLLLPSGLNGIDDDPEKGVVKVVMTGSASDKPLLRFLRLTRLSTMLSFIHSYKKNNQSGVKV